MKKVYAYVRVSSTGQLKGDGPRRQRQAIKEYGKHNGLKIVGWYEDGYTGTDFDRPEMARLLVDISKNGVRTVIIERLERLARDIGVQEKIIKNFQDENINLISTLEGPDLASEDPTRKLIRSLFGAFAEYDKAMLVQRLRVARIAQGKLGGRPRTDTYPPKVRKKIARLKEQGKSQYQIARILNEQKVPCNSKCGKWYGQLVRQIAT